VKIGSFIPKGMESAIQRLGRGKSEQFMDLLLARLKKPLSLQRA
jgi:hypothetical protein